MTKTLQVFNILKRCKFKFICQQLNIFIDEYHTTTDDIPYTVFFFKTWVKNLTAYQNPAKIDEQTILQALDLTKENSSPVRYL